MSSSTNANTDGTAAIVEAVSAHLREDLKVDQEKVDKVMDEAKAALGLAEVEEKLEHPEVLRDGDVEHTVGNAKAPVLIKDVHAWKAGLQMSTGVRPVRDLSEFAEDAAKL
jgi:insulysin